MADWDMVIIALLAEEEEEYERKIKRRRFWVNELWLQRNVAGEYQTLCNSLSSEDFYDYLKIPRKKFYALLQFLRPDIEKQNTNYRPAISVEERLTICLRFLTTGSSFKCLSFNYRVGYSTYRSIVHDTCAVIWKKLGPVVMPKPSEELWAAIEEDFKNIWNFPNCIGALDGKHVNIRSPHNTGSQYYNYKHFFSTVLLAVVDAKYTFVIVDCGAYGRNSDGGIFSNSKLGQKLRNKTLRIPPSKSLPGTSTALPHVFVADEAFPLSENIMRPYPGNNILDRDKKIFNYRLSRARRMVESAFGILMQKFEIFERRIKVQPHHLHSIILACTCLHNYIIEDDSHLDHSRESRNMTVRNLSVQEENNVQTENMVIRDLFKQYFNSQQGSVHWQNSIIARS